MNQVKDPKTIVTPFAFSIAPSVLYTPLASPTKKGGELCWLMRY
nr:hypothetical protein [Shewanella colwelliana]